MVTVVPAKEAHLPPATTCAADALAETLARRLRLKMDLCKEMRCAWPSQGLEVILHSLKPKRPRLTKDTSQPTESQLI